MDTPEIRQETAPRTEHARLKIIIILSAFGVLGTFALLLILYLATEFVNTPHPNFPTGADITIEEGSTVRDASDMLYDESVVRSSLYLYLLLVTRHDGRYVQAGTYRFPEALTSQEVARAITDAQYLSPTLTVTFPEGFKASDMRNYLPDSYDSSEVDIAISHEGFLFPDTYHIQPNTPLSELIALMQETYERRTEEYRQLFASSTLTEYEIVTLASLVEREANDEESMKLVAGILHNRLRSGMPLQVDATFEYLLGKASHELTPDDLEIDSPYNTYTHLGLPPTPISNPGLMAIHAVLEPTPSAYFYYLTGTDGKFYYAKTFEEHKQNKARYLR